MSQTQKPPRRKVPASGSLLVRVRPEEKATWCRIARPNLSQWVINTLNREAAHELKMRR